MMSFVPLADPAPLVEPVSEGWQLIIAALLAIGLIVLLITYFKLHPFLALIFGGLTVGIVAARTSMTSSAASRPGSVRRRPVSVP